MRWFRSEFLPLFLVTSAPILSQEQSSTLHYYQRSSPQSTSQFRQSTFGVRTDQARGIGYRKGYTTVESFTIFGDTDHWMPILDVRGHLFNEGKLAGNLGVGGRRYLSSIRHTLGAFVYYDVRQHQHFTMNQISPGLEVVGKRMEYRCNAYFPLGKKHGTSHHAQFAHFQGNHIVLKRDEYRALLGVDAEVGRHWTKGVTYDLYTAVGPYYLNTMHNGAAWGGMVRIQGRYREIVSLQAKYAYDALFKNTVQGQVGLHCSFGQKLKGRSSSKKGYDPTISRATFSPYRLEIPMVQRTHRHEIAKNPFTQRPWQVWFVDNTSHSLGTYESPFSTLSDAENVSSPNDIIYVFPGNQTAQGMNQGITLQEGQQILGSGVSHSLVTTRGYITLHAVTEGVHPIITAPGNVVTLGSGNTVSGLKLIVPNGQSGIIGPGFGFLPVNNGTFTRNFISGPGDHNGLWLEGAMGHMIVQGNTIMSIQPAAANKYGILLVCPSDASLIATVQDNTIAGYDFGIAVNGTSRSTCTIQVTNNHLSAFKFGGIAHSLSGNGNSRLEVSNNILFDSDPSSVAGILIQSESGGQGACVVLNGNSVMITAPTASAGIMCTQAASAPLCIDIEGNQITYKNAVAAQGISLETGLGPVVAQLRNNEVITSNPGQQGLALFGMGTGFVTITRFQGNNLPGMSATGNVNILEPH